RPAAGACLRPGLPPRPRGRRDRRAPCDRLDHRRPVGLGRPGRQLALDLGAPAADLCAALRMNVGINCPKCGKRVTLELADMSAGKAMACEGCGELIRFKGADTA